MKLIYILVIVGIVLTTSVSAGIITNFSDGNTTGNFTYLYGTEWYTKTLNIPAGAIVSNAYIYLTGDRIYTNTTINQSLGNYDGYYYNNIYSPYNGYFLNGCGVSYNFSYINNGIQTDYGGCGSSPSTSFYKINFSVSANATNYSYYFQASTGDGLISIYCENSTTVNDWLLIGTIPATSAGVYSFSINKTACFQTTTNTVNIYNFFGTSTTAILINEVWLTPNNGNYTETGLSTYPYNVSIILNNVSTIGNYGSTNASKLDHKTIFNLTTGLTGLPSYPQNISFRTNTSGKLVFSDLYAKFIVVSNISIYTELNKTIYTTTNVSVNLVQGNGSITSYWTKNGSVLFTNPESSGIATLEYSDASTLVPRRFYFTNLEQLSQNISLYVINTSDVSQVLFTLYDETGNVLPNYYVAVYKKWLPDTTFYKVEMHKTDFNGQALLNVQLYNKLYKLLIYDSDFTLVFESGETEIKSTALTVTLQLRENAFESLGSIRNVLGGDVVYNNATRQFSVSWVDTVGIMNYSTFKTVQRTMFGDVAICTNTTFASSGTMYCTLPSASTTGTYYSSFAVETKTNHSLYLLGGQYHTDTTTAAIMGRAGILAWIFIFMGIVSMGLWNPFVAIIFGVLGMAVGVIMQFGVLEMTTLLGLMIMGGILAFKMRT